MRSASESGISCSSSMLPRYQVGRVAKKAIFARFLDRRPTETLASKLSLRLPPSCGGESAPATLQYQARESDSESVPDIGSDYVSDIDAERQASEDEVEPCPRSLPAFVPSRPAAPVDSSQPPRAASLGPTYSQGPAARELPVERPTVGSTVVVNGRAGVIATDDRSEKPFLVRFDNGTVEWYAEEQVMVDGHVLPRAAPPSAPSCDLAARAAVTPRFAKVGPTLLEHLAQGGEHSKAAGLHRGHEGGPEERERHDAFLGQTLATLPETMELSKKALQESMKKHGKIGSANSVVSHASSRTTYTDRSYATTSTVYSSASSLARARWYGRDVSPRHSRKDIAAIAGAFAAARPKSHMKAKVNAASTDRSPRTGPKLVHASSLQDAWVGFRIAGREEVVFEGGASEKTPEN